MPPERLEAARLRGSNPDVEQYNNKNSLTAACSGWPAYYQGLSLGAKWYTADRLKLHRIGGTPHL